MSDESNEKQPKQKRLHKSVSVLIVVVIIIALIAAVIVAFISVDKIKAAREYAVQTEIAQSMQSAAQGASGQ